MSFDIYYSSERTGAPRYGGGVLRYRPCTVGRVAVGRVDPGATEFILGLSQMGVVLRIFADLRHGFYKIVSNEGFLFKIGLLRHAPPESRKMRHATIHCCK